LLRPALAQAEWTVPGVQPTTVVMPQVMRALVDQVFVAHRLAASYS
jgi:hypothetical protein